MLYVALIVIVLIVVVVAVSRKGNGQYGSANLNSTMDACDGTKWARMRVHQLNQRDSSDQWAANRRNTR